MPLEAIFPATGEPVQTYESMSPRSVEQILHNNREAQTAWTQTPPGYRANVLRTVATRLGDRRDELAELMAVEMGKPVSQGRSEVEKCAWVCDYYADHGAAFLEDDERPTDASTSYVTYRPLGPILAVMPWNFPFWQVFRFLAPALMAGNSALLKHASNVPGCAMAIEEIVSVEDVPPDLFRTLLIGSEEVRSVIEHPAVAGVTLTGSTAAGRHVGSDAGGALKKTVLELGGSDPYLILSDADLELAVEKGVTSRLINGGQSCIAAKRFVVVEEVLEEFTNRFVTAMDEVTVGDPLEDPDVGPQARVDLRDELHQQVLRSVESGAVCRLGGDVPGGTGAFYPPTVLTDVRPGSPAYDEELFGPVAAIIGVNNEEEAIRVANDSVFGLGAAVFTRDVERGERIAAERLEAGCCFVNDFVRSDPRLPFGGIKQSGYGRELSEEGIREFVNTKTVYVA